MYPQRRRRPLGNRTNVFSVPRDSVERACRPLRESHHRTWFTMDALLATARRPVSDRGEKRAVAANGAAVPRGSAYIKKALPKRCHITPMRYTPQPRKAIEVSANLAKCAQIADPKVARFGQLGPTRLSKAQQAKIPHEKSKGLRAGSSPSKRGIDHSGDVYGAGYSASNIQRRAL